MRNPAHKKTRKSEDLLNFKSQEIAKSPQSITPKFLTNEKEKDNFLGISKKRNGSHGTFKPAIQEWKISKNQSKKWALFQIY